MKQIWIFSTFSYRVTQETKYDISDVMLWKNIRGVMLILLFVHDTRLNLTKCVSCQIIL